MADEVPVDENSDEVTKSGVASFNTKAAKASQALDDEKRFKVVHFVRHGEGYHNIGFESLEDTHLTANGWSQAGKLQKHLNNLPKPLDLEVVIVSPLFRTLETASGVFGGGTIDNGQKMLMLEQTPVHNEVTRHYAIAERPGVPFIANEQCRERMSLNRCDRRRNLSETAKNFPGVDFSLIEHENDVMWDLKHDEAVSAGAVGSRYFIGEKGDAVAERGMNFLKWVMDRPEKHLGVVSHCAFLHETLQAAAKDSPPELAQALSRDFRNCEMRSVVFDKDGKPVEILKDTYYAGGAPRYYLFPLNWGKQAVGSLVGEVKKRVPW
ncbi:hypothetical protein KFL_003220100 [Klebsormidium nitens]|uniref:Phosphoglycerate mutase family protein n=1 Tax=Klebsormidium nitens TaxID=105231 RepID=A0A1Y1IFS0_KLENI|nr:hypothetical protein KFL_003220100 [Klebsormidium nitens]|eukprot:GAQ86948.1 hypothetical protein KFL_003220100 [Klebsormidium nitens]